MPVAEAHVLGQSIEWLRALAVLHSSLEAVFGPLGVWGLGLRGWGYLGFVV